MPGMADRRAIIIDTDPGQDDALAILLALASEELEVLGITAVAGNVPLALTEKNVRKICELAGKPETKVFAGASGRWCANWSRRNTSTARPGSTGRTCRNRPWRCRNSTASISSSKCCGSARRRRGDAVHAGTADQCRAGADPRARHRTEDRSDRDDGRRVLRGRQHDAGGGVQHLCRSACREDRVRVRRSDHDDPARLHAQGADDA
jgi:hypothetical protein